MSLPGQGAGSSTANHPPSVWLQGLSKSFGAFPAVRQPDLEIERGEFSSTPWLQRGAERMAQVRPETEG